MVEEIRQHGKQQKYIKMEMNTSTWILGHKGEVALQKLQKQKLLQ